ncbi:FeoA family protein [Bythopirellula polymerisocia]|uniref:FeoA domain protein n=1 Tax=Bythopirellula polymerisocia TaxID=2528003 RepID=A0A5C6CUU4_9BACT|nr:FeoA family protein [Bythopirellula polymerisocia]TWU28198.1 FeoA domain protein [Bythopirellula polymerisocia]
MPHVENIEPLITLGMLRSGQQATVHSLVGSTELVRHLSELGIHEGALLEMLRPGSTCILRINGTKLCVRGDELLRVMVTPLTTTRQAG